MTQPNGEVTTTLITDNKLVAITSLEGDHDCCYQVSCLDKEGVDELIQRLTKLHSQMVD